MKNNILRKPRNVRKKDKGDLTERLLLAFATVITTAIFYFTGWVYIAHWYGYYGIDAAQINLSLQLILIHGIPSVLFLVVAGLIAVLGTAILKKEALSQSDLPTIVFMAYGLTMIPYFPLLILFLQGNGNWIPFEAFFSFVVIFIWLLIFMAIGSAASIRRPFLLIFLDKVAIMIDNALMKNITVRPQTISSQTPKSGSLREATKELRQSAGELRRLVRPRILGFPDAVYRTQNFWIGMLLLFYFLISISTSAILGEWDASRGARIMVGDWHIPEISLYSTSNIPALKKFETPTATGFEYTPLGLLANGDNVYYLIDWKTEYYYMQKPNIYIIPRSDDLVLNFIVVPYRNPTKTPLPTNTLTATATATPLLTLTVKPRP